MRSVVLFTAEQKPSSVSSAENNALARSNSAKVTQMAARPASLMMARVLLPLVSARRAKRLRSRGPSEIFRLSSAAWVPALACTRPMSRAALTSPSVRSTLTASRTARTATAGRVTDASASARRIAAMSTTSRTERPAQDAKWALNHPALRAALTRVRPARTGAVTPRAA
jgi:hypothetical protein